MALTQCIIYSFVRSAPGQALSVKAGKPYSECIGPVASLFDQLKRAFQRSAQKQFGRFDDEASPPLAGWAKDYIESKSSFESLAASIMKQLATSMDSIDDAFSAQIMIAEELLLEQKRLYLLWTEFTEALNVNGEGEVESCRYLDGNRLPYALKLHIDEWLLGESNKYMSLLAGRGNKAISEAFKIALGFSQGVDLEKQTKEFLRVVERYTEELPDDKRDSQKEQILDYCVAKDSLGEEIVIADLSELLSPDQPKAFSSFVEQSSQEEQNSLHLHRSSLKRYVRFSGRDKYMSISFSSRLFGDNVVFDANSGELTLKKVPKSLRNQIRRHRDAEE
ncbi:MAG TPA: nucleoid-associated protein [Pseudomonadales bacterium]|nr:nucleoid-associated protein [Pseudomonadales bacterium]